MITDKAKWTVDSDGTWICFRGDGSRKLCETIEPGKIYDVEVKRHREKRSLDANAYCWVLLDKLAAKLGVSKTALYREYIRDIGGNCETVCVLEKAAKKLCDGWEHNGLGWQTDTYHSKIEGCVNVILYYGSSTYDTAQMSRLIDLVVQDCKEQEIETMSPDKLAALLEGWNGV